MIQFRNPSTGLIETFKGLKGNDGKSAYEYATSMGYPGSEEDFAKLMSYDAKEAIEKLLQDIAGVANIEEVTQAEYDALGNEKLSNDVMYCIKDGDENANDPNEINFPSIIYSPSKNYKASMQDDGNFVIYDNKEVPYFDTLGTKRKQSVLLWSNPDQTVAFPAQTIPLDLTSYAAVKIEFSHYLNESSSYVVTSVGKMNFFTMIEASTTSETASTSESYEQTRKYWVNSDGIKFIQAYKRSGTETSWIASNDRCVPARIWGLKEV